MILGSEQVQQTRPYGSEREDRCTWELVAQVAPGGRMEAQSQQLLRGRQPGHALDGHVEGVLDELACACTGEFEPTIVSCKPDETANFLIHSLTKAV